MTVTETGAAELTKRRLTTLYETMCTAAALDTRLLNGIKRGEFATVIWPSRGQEAIPAALGLALRTDDRLITTYRGLHDHVAKGVPLTEIIGEVLGTSVGASKGKGGTMHISAPAHGVMMTTGIVGSGVPVAVGLALAAKKQGSDRVTVVTFGDGATNTGSFHEGVNLAATWQLPVVFLCQNNLYAEMTPVEETMAVPHVADRAKGVGMPGVTVDGNDPVATYRAIAEAVDRARAGGGPTLVEAVTFRFEGHYAGDASKYIPKEQMARMRAHDPMVTFPRTLLEHGFDQAELDEIKAAAERAVDEAVRTVVAAPPPDRDEIQLDVYADGLVVTHD
ncbi:thiamine pyrophosphate-dependent dehydrogenase E1 component subunit alpha [Streptomyces sp. NPDC048106]|uniref:thiamine pyrophosphate-dependent dehydrogenase E1 component subunit alpha n=1 Tax=Streptomyces sp. NPDC048106 TaxID=3155750 RepID=UPI0034518DB9